MIDAKVEQARLEQLRKYELLDTAFEERFDALTRLASHVCKTPICLISLVDSNRQWFKSRVGIDADETPRDISFCQYAIEGTDLYEVPNATESDLFRENPLVTGVPNIRFYAGAPLTSPNGLNVGTLCVIDTVPRTLTEEQRDLLTDIADQVVYLFEHRLYENRLRKAIGTQQRMTAELEQQNSLLSMVNSSLEAFLDDANANDVFEPLLRQLVKKLKVEYLLLVEYPVQTFIEPAFWEASKRDRHLDQSDNKEDAIAAFAQNESLYTHLQEESVPLANLPEVTALMPVSDFETMAVPLFSFGRLVGALLLGAVELRGFIKDPDLCRPVFEAMGRLIGEYHLREKRKKIEMKAMNDQIRHMLIVQAAKLGTWDLTVRSMQLECNEEFATLLGLEDGEQIEDLENFRKFIHPYDRSSFEEALAAHLSGKTQGIDVEIRILLENADLKWVHFRGEVTVRSPSGKSLRVCGTLLDISAQKEQERRVVQQVERLKVLSDVASQSLNGADWQIDELLRRVTPLLGMDGNFVIQEDLETETQDEQRIKFLQKLGASNEHDICQWSRSELEGVEGSFFPDGQKFYAGSVSIFGARLGWLVFYRDSQNSENGLTEADKEFIKLVCRWIGSVSEQGVVSDNLESTNLELSRSNAALDEFTRLVSHDLKAPLRGIKNLANWIKEDAADSMPEASVKDLDMLRERVSRMQKMLDDLLDYSRIGFSNETEIIEISDLVMDVVALVDPGRTFDFEIEPAMGKLQLPRTEVEKIFRNLISNAIKHHDKQQGKIKITSRPATDGIEFSVEDDGPGIPPAEHKRIFDMFTTLKPRDKVEGTGLGLSFVKKAVETYGGQVSVFSEGRGANFTFTLKDKDI